MSEDDRILVLILTGNTMLGNQLASLLHEHGWQTQVVRSDVQVYNMILTGTVHAIVADIDDLSLSGLSVLVLCKYHEPSITSYAICRDGHGKPMQIARSLNCAGYFYLKQGEIQQIDTNRGMAARLVSSVSMDGSVFQSVARRISHAG